ncbi:hypothetical protein [Sinomonas humi]|uniref:Uncharacterized protein n=1 Tax=Sinomonas humi TaxID=1338436 RepID=A0A0B2AKW4_9MICC|nr:hypothetical protein [Sinomonas humi]KHL02441.1 hypothetical protein LK10_12655 [Sinomonas humi]
MVPLGVLLPQSILATNTFNVLMTFVAINTLLYVALSILKALPRLRVSLFPRRYRRSETRSIYPDGPL